MKRREFMDLCIAAGIVSACAVTAGLGLAPTPAAKPEDPPTQLPTPESTPTAEPTVPPTPDINDIPPPCGITACPTPSTQKFVKNLGNRRK